MNFSSTQNTKNLKDFIEKIPSRGIPKKVTITYLVGLGYKSTNDRTIIAVLKSIGLVEGNGQPSQHFSKMRSSDGKKNLAELIKKTYNGLFEIYPDGQNQPEEKLRDYFTSVTSVGDASLKNIINTFQALCSVADFSGGPSTVAQSNEPLVNPNPMVQVTPQNMSSSPTQKGSSEIHFNIQVHVPGEQSPETYEAIFKNLGKYVLGFKEDNK